VPPGSGQDAFLRGCIAQLHASQQWFIRSVLPLSLDQLRWRPGLGCWSIGECLDHLNLTLAYYLPRIEQALGESRRQPPDRMGSVLFAKSEDDYLRQVEPPVVFKASAPAALQPTEAVDPDRIVDQFTEFRERYGTIVGSMSRLNLDKISITGSLHSPVGSLGGLVALLAAHDRRHIWQAERMRDAKGFPLPRQ
jgi:hypothetical protein